MKIACKYLSIRAQGMTLMEVVIAIAVIAFVVPIIIAATGVASRSRSQAEADTRGAWIVRKIQQEISAKWSEPVQKNVILSKFDFPSNAANASSAFLLFDKDGEFLEEGIRGDFERSPENVRAAFVVKISAEKYEQNAKSRVYPQEGFSLIRVDIAHPAQAAASVRNIYRYQFIRSKGGMF